MPFRNLVFLQCHDRLRINGSYMTDLTETHAADCRVLCPIYYSRNAEQIVF